MAPLLYLPVAAPLTAAGLAALTRRGAGWFATTAALAILVAGLAQAAPGRTRSGAAHGLLHADALSAYLLIVIGAVATIACWAGADPRCGAPTTNQRRYRVLVQLFLACMCLAVLASNLGLLWIAVEATTIVTAFLVGHHRTRAGVEAAWKYVVLCSIGVAIALLGIVCIYAAAVATGEHGLTALTWTRLSASTTVLDPGLLRFAAGLILLGFATKAGLAPMHAWLPDAHSQAPAPVSALMSGVLLAVAFYAIWRVKAFVDPALGPAFTRGLLFTGALLSLTVAAALLIAQRNLKRLLAYSSIEHMGLIAFGSAIGGRAALSAVLLHVLGHGITKAVAFTGAGIIGRLTPGPLLITATRGLTTRYPAVAAIFGLALAALLGLPPFSLFASELGIARAGFTSGHGWATAAAFGLVFVSFAAIVRHGATTLLGDQPDPIPNGDHVATPHSRLALLAGALVIAAAMGLTLGPLSDLLTAAAAIAGGQP